MEVFLSQIDRSRLTEKELNLLKLLESKRTIEQLPEPTPLVVSVRSAKCYLTHPIHMGKAFPIIHDIVEQKKSQTIIGLKRGETQIGYRKKKAKTKVRNQTKEKEKRMKDFNNQITVVVKPSPENERTKVNIKFFSNHSISMTGCKEKMDGFRAVSNFLDEMRSYPELFIDDEDRREIGVKDYSITMINSDFNMNYRIDRTKLYKMMLQKYGVYTSYNPDDYQGVNIGYMLNADNPERDGKCKCAVRCTFDKKERKKKKNRCKLITIVVFQSGSVIITGANEDEQLMEAYRFITQLLKDNYHELVIYSITDVKK